MQPWENSAHFHFRFLKRTCEIVPIPCFLGHGFEYADSLGSGVCVLLTTRVEERTTEFMTQDIV